LKALGKRGITKTRKPALSLKLVKSQQLVSLIQLYQQILANSPWSRADQTMRDRLGLTHGSVGILEEGIQNSKEIAGWHLLNNSKIN
jgi:hypothetical protein